jgi:hypothetical protein
MTRFYYDCADARHNRARARYLDELARSAVS